MLTPNLTSAYHDISKAIEQISFAISTPDTILHVAQHVPQHTDRIPILIDNIVYSEEILTEILQQLQKARRNFHLLVDGLVKVPMETSTMCPTLKKKETLCERDQRLDREAARLLKPLHEFENNAEHSHSFLNADDKL